MNITILAIYVRGADAVGTQLSAWVRALQGGGHHVRVVAEQIAADAPADIRALTSVCSGPELPHSPLWSMLEASDLVICDYPAAFGLAECLRLLRAPRVLFSYHGVTPPALWPTAEGRAYLERSRQRAALVHFADRAVTRSEFTRQELHHLTGYPLERIVVVPCSVPPPGDVPSLPRAADPLILSVGRLAANKRPVLLVEALAQVRRELPAARLVLAGDAVGAAHAPVAADVRARAAALGLADAVTLTGLISDAELEGFYRRASLLVSASVHEGFCVPIIEAMSRDVPVVGVAAGALPETIGDAGLIVPPDDSAALAEAMLRLLRDADLRQTLIARGRERARRFHPGVVGAILLRLIEDLPAQPRRSGLPRLSQLAPIAALEPAAEVAPTPARVTRLQQVAQRARRWLVGDLERRLSELVDRQVAFNRVVARSLLAADEWSAAASEEVARHRHARHDTAQR